MKKLILLFGAIGISVVLGACGNQGSEQSKKETEVLEEQKIEESDMNVEPESKEETKTNSEPRYDYNYSYSQQTNQPPQQPIKPKSNGGCLRVFGVVAFAILFAIVCMTKSWANLFDK